MFVGRWRGTSSVLAGACAVFFADTALAAGLGALAAAESPSLPLFAAFAAAASAAFGTVAPRRELRAARPGGLDRRVRRAGGLGLVHAGVRRAVGRAVRRRDGRRVTARGLDGLGIEILRESIGAMLVSAALVAVTGTRGRGRREAGFRARTGRARFFFLFC